MRDQTYTRGGFGDNISDVVLLGSLGIIAVIGAGTWLTGQLAGLLFDQRWPPVSFPAAVGTALELPRHLGDPREAWPASARPDLPGVAGFIVAGLLALGVLTAVGVFGVRAWFRRRPQRGFASQVQIRRALSEKAVIKRGPAVRPSLKGQRIRVEDVGVRVGRAIPSGTPVALSAEESVLLLAAARSGKTSQFIIPGLRSWPGAAFVTSLREDVLLATATLRQKTGPVKVMAPTGSIAWPDLLRWDLTSGCADFNKARTRADVMVVVGAKGAGDSTNEGFFRLSATNLLAGWLHAAALSGGSANDVIRWAFDERIDEPIKILGSNPDAVEGGAAMLDALYRQPADSTRPSLWATAQTALAPLLAPDARAVFTPPPGESVDLEGFLRDCGTCYLIVDERRASSLAPVITAFADELIQTHQAIARKMPGGRPDNLLAMFLDEVGNITPLPQLPALMSFSGGTGIFVTAVLQNRAQARDRWGPEGADMLWGAATTKLILGGLSGPELDDISKIAGEFRETVINWQRGGQGGPSMSSSLQDRRTMTPEEIRTLDTLERQALVIQSSTPAVKVRMTRYYEGPDREEYAAAEKEARRIAGLDG